MKKYILALTLLLGISYGNAQQTIRDDSWQLVWHDEFETPIDWTVWHSEHGFVRNHDKDPWWAMRFHTWLMDWTENYIRIYLDGELINDIDLSKTINGSIGNNTNPYHAPHYILLNLALGGDNGGRISDDTFPMRYEIDYVRVWQKK